MLEVYTGQVVGQPGRSSDSSDKNSSRKNEYIFLAEDYTRNQVAKAITHSAVGWNICLEDTEKSTVSLDQIRMFV